MFRDIHCWLITASLLVATSSCGTLFTSSRQDITIKGTPTADVYDGSRRIGEISKNGFATLPVRKSLKSKKITVKLDGYQTREVIVKSKFNPVSVANLINPIAWAIDVCTGKVCKYSNDVVETTLTPIEFDYDNTASDIDDDY